MKLKGIGHFQDFDTFEANIFKLSTSLEQLDEMPCSSISEKTFSIVYYY